MILGKSVPRVDAYEKVTGRAKYTADLIDEKACLVAKVVHSTVANALVTAVDIGEAEKVEGVEKIFTCFDVPDFPFSTAGHPWSNDPAHRDIADRLLLNRRVRFYGDDVAVVVASDEVAASRAARAVQITYDEYPFVLDAEKASAPGAPLVHDGTERNILGKTEVEDGDFDAAIAEAGLLRVDGVYETPIVQHCHIEPVISYAFMENGRIVVVSSTQIPHIIRRICAQALGRPWGDLRIIKPYIGGGFGNKQDALYEPLNAYLTEKLGGRPVKLEISREEIFESTRTRHAERIYLSTWARKDGRFVARSYTSFSNQGAYASHGHAVTAKGTNTFRQLYTDEKARRTRAYTVYTNVAAAGAMRGYGTPQANFAVEAHLDDVAAALNIAPLALRFKNVMPQGYTDPFTKNVNRDDSFRQCVDKCLAALYGKTGEGGCAAHEEARKKNAAQTGPVRRGIGAAIFWYNTAVWPISLELSAVRMVLNQDGTVQLQLAETEIGQGADTVFAQMAAETLGLASHTDVHVISTQDTDITPFGTGAYASRQSYVGGMGVHKGALALKDKILAAASDITGVEKSRLDIAEGCIICVNSGAPPLLSLGDLATRRLYDMRSGEHLSAEVSALAESNAYSFGCCFAEIEVDIPLGKIKLLRLIDAHDCGRLLNPQLAEAQVHGGMSMAAGYALSEEMKYDEKTGKLLNGNLLDYKLSTALDQPAFEALFVENWETTGAYGSKALGEPPAVPGAAAIRNALYNAAGIAVNKIPLSPPVLINAFKDAGLI